MTNTHFQLQHRRVHQQHGNKDDRMSILKNVADEQIVHFFRTNKVEISAAIDNPYPFLYSLKDHDLITEEVLEQSRNKSVTWNLNEKVYLILSEFEKSGISVIRQVMSLLWKDTNLQHYPKLKDIYSYFYKDGTNVAETPLSEVSFKTGSPDVSSSGSGPVSEPVFTDISYNTPVPDVSSSGSVSVTEMEFSEVPYSVASPDVSSSGDWTKKMVGKKSNKSKKASQDFTADELDVKCGSANGVLYKELLAKGSQEKCIKTPDGKLFSVIEFEAHGGRSRSKCWKRSISCNGVTLAELILHGHLPNPPKLRGRSVSTQPQKRAVSPPATLSRQSTPSKVTKEELDAFDYNELPVVCGSSNGSLHKHRFASGNRGKCVRTTSNWCTPEEFASKEGGQDLSSWREKILCNNVSLDTLIKKGYLKPHVDTCICSICADEAKLQDENDDVCAVCKDGGDLSCCDECPRAFHTSCHIPEIPSVPDSSTKWSCTICNLENQRKPKAEPPFCLESEVLTCDMKPPRRLKCEYLLLKLYIQEESSVFVRDPRETIPNYEHYIPKPMWLNKVKYNLADGKYNTVGAFVRDVRQVFYNCAEFNKEKNSRGWLGEDTDEEKESSIWLPHFELRSENYETEHWRRKLQEDFEKAFFDVFDIRGEENESEELSMTIDGCVCFFLLE